MENKYLKDIVTMDEENDIKHYGVVGMHWGVRRYQPYSLIPRKSGKGGKETGQAKKASKASNAVSTAISKIRGGKSVDKNTKKVSEIKKETESTENKLSRNQKSAEAKARVEAEAITARQRKEELDRLIKNGTATEIYSRRSELSGKQLQEAVNRLNTEKTLKSLVAEENPTGLQKAFKELDKVNDAAKKGLTYYDTAKKVSNIAKDHQKAVKEKENKEFLKNASLDEIMARSKDFSNKDITEARNKAANVKLYQDEKDLKNKSLDEIFANSKNYSNSQLNEAWSKAKTVELYDEEKKKKK